jgi:hypothetical protein
MEQTAVEWLEKAIALYVERCSLQKEFNQAKEMEKEQIIRARQDGLDNGFSNGSWDSNLYYNETFKSE